MAVCKGQASPVDAWSAGKAEGEWSAPARSRGCKGCLTPTRAPCRCIGRDRIRANSQPRIGRIGSFRSSPGGASGCRGWGDPFQRSAGSGPTTTRNPTCQSQWSGLDLWRTVLGEFVILRVLVSGRRASHQEFADRDADEVQGDGDQAPDACDLCTRSPARADNLSLARGELYESSMKSSSDLHNSVV